ncbi:WXG100 family type VII secretion target [Pseudarthrobacter sp. NPDC058329]|uniref:WXG100 family type VII secretion target n=1 Tax=Pseudarthrobacter sp. NPDC058329 TaxID=3346448 RepID=UPI0036DCFA65
MAPGLYGADIEQLRSLSKTMGLSGSRLMETERRISSLVSSAGWKGNDALHFRREWSDTWRPMMNRTSQSLIDASKMLLTQADEQENASTSSGGDSSPGGAANPPSPGASGTTPSIGLEGVLSVAGSPGWWAANAAVTGAGLYTDNLLATMAKGGLLTKLTNWPWLTAQYAQTPGVGYVRGTQVLNGTSMLGRLSGGLGVATGLLQIGQGATTGNTGMVLDGSISTVLAAGSFIPGAGPFFAVAGIAWGGMGLLATNLGYGSASEMVGDAAKKTVDAVADGAKKVWGWLT